MISVGNIGTAAHTLGASTTGSTEPAHTSGNLLLGIGGRRTTSALGTDEVSVGTSGYDEIYEYEERALAIFGSYGSGTPAARSFGIATPNVNNPAPFVILEVSGAQTSIGGILNGVVTNRVTTTTSIDFPTFTTTVNGCLIVDIAIASSARTVTPTVGYNERVDYSTTDGSGVTLFVQTRVQATAGATGDHSATGSSNSGWNIVSLAIKPSVIGAARSHLLRLMT
jgi:hypothetical protein